MPLPAWIRVPVPEIVTLKLVPWVIVLLRLKVSVPSFMIELDADKEPDVEPLPICRVPALIVVEPVNVLLALSTQLPLPLFTKEVRMVTELSVSVPAIKLLPVLLPVSVMVALAA